MEISTLYELYLAHPDITTDTRKIREGCLFVALKGEQFDGHDFAEEALRKGAAYAIVSQPQWYGPRFIHVPDTLVALQQLAKHHRRQFHIPVIAITGSNGKTTTKELITLALSTSYKVHATAGNLNNHIGVPLTLLSAPLDTEILVCEMGANHQHEIQFLCELASPTHGLITNIGSAHLEGFGSFEGVKKAKGELFDYLKDHDGLAFINMDDPSLEEMSKHLPHTVRYGLKPESRADYHFEFTDLPDHSGFTIRDRQSPLEITSNMFGAYNALNLLAAFTIGSHFQINPDGLVKRLSAYVSGSNRSEILQWKGCTIIKDAYNANPSSMELAIQAFSQRYPTGWVIVGDMKELGGASQAAHLQIISSLLEKRFTRIFLVGPAFGSACEALQTADGRLQHYLTIEALKAAWNWTACEGQSLMLKGSRSMHLENLLES